MKYHLGSEEQLTLPGLADQEESNQAVPSLKRKAPAKPASELAAIPYLVLDLSCGHVDLFGSHYWELRSPYREGELFLNTGPAPREPVRTSLSDILEPTPAQKYYLSQTACLGILRRAKERGKELPHQLKVALTAQAGLDQQPQAFQEIKAYHINQRDEGIDLDGVSGALMATNNMQMQTFVTLPKAEHPIAFAANQRDEVRDLHDVAGALSAQPGMKQQTFVAGFSAGAGACAGSIAYSEQIAPTLKGSASGNCMPSILCLNDQGGSVMDCSEDVSGTLRAQEHGHQPLVFDNHGQDTRFCGPVDCAQTISASFGEGGNNQPLVYENHGIDARYTGPHPVVPTLSARAGTGGNNLPLVEQDPAETFCITGNAIDRQPQNGGNGIGYQEDVSYTLTATDHHAVFSRQRADKFSPSDVASTESARQYKDATDLIHQAAGRGSPQLIRRLTPLECERLQGFPDGWTALPGASDSARYRALGNSVAIPCVEFIMRGVIIAAGYSA